MSRQSDTIDVQWVNPENFSLLEQLFATSAGVGACWCIWPRVAPGRHAPDTRGNRNRMLNVLESGESPGLLAVASERPVGWCAFGLRDNYPQYASARDPNVWAVACIFVPACGDEAAVARSLIRYALKHAESRGAEVVEGPPVWWLPGDTAAIERASRFFLDNGFERVASGARMPALRFRWA